MLELIALADGEGAQRHCKTTLPNAICVDISTLPRADAPSEGCRHAQSQAPASVIDVELAAEQVDASADIFAAAAVAIDGPEVRVGVEDVHSRAELHVAQTGLCTSTRDAELQIDLIWTHGEHVVR